MQQSTDESVSTLSKVPLLTALLSLFKRLWHRFFKLRLFHLISNALRNQWAGQHFLTHPLPPRITYVLNEEQLSFSAEQRIPFSIRFRHELSQCQRLVYLALIALVGLLVAKQRWLSAFALFSMASFVYRQNRLKTRNRDIRRCFRLLMNNPDSLAAFQKRIGAPTMLRQRSEQMWEERADWLNDLVIKFWPYVNSLIQNEIDKQKLSEVGFVISNGHVIHFERFTLGDKPPVISYICVDPKRARSDELVIDMKVLYIGNCLLSFTKKTLMMFHVKAGVKDIYLRANARLRLRPLLNTSPYFGGYAFSLLERPILDYEGINLANLADNKLIKNFLINQISQVLVDPNQLYFALSTEPEVVRRLKAPFPIGLCVFQVIEAENLPAFDNPQFLLPNPFCVVRIGGVQFETPIVFNTYDPYWDTMHASPIHDLHEMIKIELFDKDALSADDYVGAVEFRIKDIALDLNLNGLDKWVPISRSSAGALHFRCTYFRLQYRLTTEQLRANQRLLQSSALKFPLGVLSIYVYWLELAAHVKQDAVPLLQLKHNGMMFESQPLPLAVSEDEDSSKKNKGQETAADLQQILSRSKRRFVVEQRFQVTTMDPFHEIVELSVLDVSGFNVKTLKPLQVFANRVLGGCTISLNSVLDKQTRLNAIRSEAKRSSNGRQTLNQRERGEDLVVDDDDDNDCEGLRLDFELAGRSSNVSKQLTGRLRLFARLSCCHISDQVYRNLQRKPYIKANPDQPTSETSFFRRILLQPGPSFRHPLRTLKTLKSPEFAFLQAPRVRVANQQSPPPAHLNSNYCHVKLRFVWTERKRLHFEVLNVTNVPSELIDKPKTRFSIRLMLVDNKVDSSSVKTQAERTSMSSVELSQLISNLDTRQLRQEGQSTRRFLFNRSLNCVLINERLCFTIDPKQYIDSYRLLIQLYCGQSRHVALHCCIQQDRLVAANEINVPSIAFRSENIERWIRLLNPDKKEAKSR